jgi:four helix bundle protein
MRAETITSFHDLEVWREAVELSIDCYKLTDRFPRAERFGLTSQIRRSAVSIASNIAEGHARKARGVYRHHVKIALGSEAELENAVKNRASARILF